MYRFIKILIASLLMGIFFNYVIYFFNDQLIFTGDTLVFTWLCVSYIRTNILSFHCHFNQGF